MVTPPACSTTWSFTLARSFFFEVFLATTCTSAPLVPVAVISPFTPLISSVRPAGTTLFQFQTSCPITGVAMRVAASASANCVRVMRFSLVVSDFGMLRCFRFRCRLRRNRLIGSAQIDVTAERLDVQARAAIAEHEVHALLAARFTYAHRQRRVQLAVERGDAH